MSDNPSAFPLAGGGPMGRNDKGMTLRDWFASHAPEPPTNWWRGRGKNCAGYALWNFQYADAMLAARTGEQP